MFLILFRSRSYEGEYIYFTNLNAMLLIILLPIYDDSITITNLLFVIQYYMSIKNRAILFKDVRILSIKSEIMCLIRR